MIFTGCQNWQHYNSPFLGLDLYTQHRKVDMSTFSKPFFFFWCLRVVLKSIHVFKRLVIFLEGAPDSLDFMHAGLCYLDLTRSVRHWYIFKCHPAAILWNSCMTWSKMKCLSGSYPWTIEMKWRVGLTIMLADTAFLHLFQGYMLWCQGWTWRGLFCPLALLVLCSLALMLFFLMFGRGNSLDVQLANFSLYRFISGMLKSSVPFNSFWTSSFKVLINAVGSLMQGKVADMYTSLQSSR